MSIPVGGRLAPTYRPPQCLLYIYHRYTCLPVSLSWLPFQISRFSVPPLCLLRHTIFLNHIRHCQIPCTGSPLPWWVSRVTVLPSPHALSISCVNTPHTMVSSHDKYYSVLAHGMFLVISETCTSLLPCSCTLKCNSRL